MIDLALHSSPPRRFRRIPPTSRLAGILGIATIAAFAATAGCSADKRNEVNVGQECVSTDTCADDGNSCTAERCVEGACKHEPMADKSACAGGLCWDGACCHGCWDGAKCDTFGATQSACGKNGTECVSCDDSLSCTRDACEDRECTHTALADGAACQDGFLGSCRSGVCHCGGRGEPCCSPATCENGLACDEGVCVDCGLRGQPCCAGSGCSSDSACVAGQCEPCGAVGEACCGSLCDQGAVCGMGTCESCGGLGEPCCDGESPCADDQLACDEGTCAHCGRPDEPCCANQTCWPQGDSCSLEQCVAGICGQDAAPDETDCGAGVCRGGACCAGCWDALSQSCTAGIAPEACGGQGGLCTDCSDDNECTIDRCEVSTRTCGQLDQPEGTKCSAGRCSGGQCISCGQLGAVCCAMSLPLGQYPCESGSACDDQAGLCATCGSVGELCCEGDAACGAGEVCRGLTCATCGAVGQPCCDGASCSSSTALCASWGECASCDLLVVAGDRHTCFVQGAYKVGMYGQVIGYDATGIACSGAYKPSLGSAPVATPEFVPPPAGVSWDGNVAVGDNHTCATGKAGTQLRVYCWGDNTYGQLGDGTTTASDTPVLVKTISAPASEPGAMVVLSAGADHTCATAWPGTTSWCWGRNHMGQLGLGDTSVRLEPAAVPAVSQVTMAAGHRTCALGSGEPSELWCWGQNDHGQLGLGSGAPVVVASPAHILDTSRALWGLRMGRDHACYVQDGELLCWGMNDHGQLGLGDTADRLAPTKVPVSGTATDCTVGRAHSCVFLDNGGSGALCWGANEAGQLGIAPGPDQLTPIALPQPNANLAWIQAGADITCGMDAQGLRACWGRDEAGELGDGAPMSNHFLPSRPDVACKP